MKVKIREFEFQKGLKNSVDYLLEEQKVEILEEIISIMREKNITRAELARRLGTSPAYITKIFRMNTNFTLESLVKIAHSIGSKISIHFHQPEAKPIWFDLYKEYREVEPMELEENFSSNKGRKEIKYIRTGRANYEQSATAA